jgi:hypothetical protein
MEEETIKKQNHYQANSPANISITTTNTTNTSTGKIHGHKRQKSDNNYF